MVFKAACTVYKLHTQVSILKIKIKGKHVISSSLYSTITLEVKGSL